MNLHKLLLERMTFDQLFKYSEPKRVKRSLTVRGPPLEVDANSDAIYHTFNFKSFPSTTGLRHRGYIKFLRPRNQDPSKVALQHVPCVVDCDCFDYRYRYSWVNKQKGSSVVGPNSLNKALNQAPKITNPAGIPGLCVAEGERIATNRGLMPIEKVVVGDEVWTLEGWQSVTAAACTGIKQVCDITLDSGLVISVTPEHEVLAFDDATGFNWVQAGALTPKHRLCSTFPADVAAPTETIEVPHFLSSNKNIEYVGQTVALNEVVGELVGYMAAEGSTLLFAGQDQRLVKDFTEKWTATFGPKAATPSKIGCYTGIHGMRVLEGMGFVFGSYDKVVPDWVMRAKRATVIAFLRGAYAGDGNFRNRHSTYASVSQNLARYVHLLLSFVGVQASVNCYKSGVKKCDTWVVRTSCGEETGKLFKLLNPIRGYSTATSLVGKPALSNYLFVNAFNLFENVVARTLPICDSDETVILTQAVHSIPDCHGIWVDRVASDLAKKGQLIKVRLRAIGKPHNAVKLRDLYEAVRGHRARCIVRKLDLPVADSPWRMHRMEVRAGLEKLKVLLPAAYDALKTIVRDDVAFDKVKSVTHGEITRVYDLKVNNASHFTVCGIVVHNCKHLLGTRDYIYGLMAKFPEGEPDTAEKLNKLIQYSNKRFADEPGAMAAARAREARYAAGLRRQRLGLKPENEPTQEAPPEQTSELPSRLPEQPTKAPLLPKAGKPSIQPQSYAAHVPPPSARGRALPVGAAKEKPVSGSERYAQQAKKAGVPTAAELRHRKTIGDSLRTATEIVNELLLENSNSSPSI